MPQQLIFTSAVRGIAPGSSGYCTVARSVEMRDGLISRLEQLSVYQHQPNSVNPIVLSHRIVSLRGTIFHVLSRTLDAGLDYTNRTNFIAHHVIFQPHELHGACSPADYLLHWPGWLSSWESDPAWTDDQAASLHNVQNLTSLPAQNWAGWSGNASNASLLFESTKARDAALVVDPGQESSLIYLFAESVLLLSKNKDDKLSQWQVPFTTFFQSKDEVSDFRWRGIWPEVNMSKAERGALLLDFRNPASFPSPAGTLAEWATTGIAPRPALTPDVSIIAESQPVLEEMEGPISIPNSRPTRTGDLHQSSRKKSHKASLQQPEEDELMLWFMRWRWVLLAGLAVIAIAIGVAVAMLTGPKVDSGSVQGPQVPQRTVISVYTPTLATPTQPAQNSFQAPLMDKPLTSTNLAATSQPAPAKPKATPSVLKDVPNPPPKPNIPPVAQVAPNTQEEAIPLDQALDKLPKGEVYLILKDQSNLDTTPLPTDLATKLASWNASCHYSISTKTFSAVGNLKPDTYQDQLVLRINNDRHAYLSAQGIRIEGQELNETFYIQFVSGNETISIIIINPDYIVNMFHLSKSLVQLGSDGVSVTKPIADYFSKWQIFDTHLNPLPLRLQMTTAKKTFSAPDENRFTISWKDSMVAVQKDLSEQNVRKQTDEKNIRLKNEADGISFSDVPGPLVLDDKVKTLSKFLSSETAKTNPKSLVLINYATEILKSLSTEHGNSFTPKYNLPTAATASAGKSWLSDEYSALQKDLENQDQAFPGENTSNLNASIEKLCSAWKANFIDSPNLNDLLNLTSDSIASIIGAQSDLTLANKQIEEDKTAAQPIQPADIQTIGLIMATQSGNSGNTLVLFDDSSAGNYAEVAVPISGGSK